MAEPTIQLGGGNWAGKTDNLLGYYKEGERFYKQDFTFSRSTTGTYTDSDGYIQEMPYNLASYSEDYTNSLQGASTTFGTITSPTNKLNASTITTTANGSYKGWNESYTLIGSTDYTFSFYVKYNNKQWLSFYHIGSAITKFDVQNGVFGSNSIGMTKEDVGDGWYRLSGTITASSGTNYFYVYNSGQNDQNSSVGDAFYLFGIQLVKGSSAKTYFPTTTRLNMPRVDYLNNSNGSLILEPQRTNLYLNSEPTANEGPAGNISYVGTSFGLGFNNYTYYSDNSVARYRYGGTCAATTEYTLSVFVIMDDNNSPNVSESSSSGDFSIIIAGTAATPISVTHYGNNIYRVIAKRTSGSSNLGNNGIVKYTGQSSVGFKVVGWQLEAGSYATSYIPTSGSSVTRNADGCSISNVADRINSSEGVLYFEGAALANDGTYRLMSISDGTSTNRITLGYSNLSNRLLVQVHSSGVSQVDFTYSISDITLYNKIALLYKSNEVTIWVNGVKGTSDTSASMPIGLSEFNFNYTYFLPLYGKVKDVRVYNTALSDSELATLTT